MHLQATLLILLTIFTSDWAHAESSSPAPVPSPVPMRLVLAPTSTPITAGKASLTLDALSREAGSFVGNYQLKVTPYFFKNEQGRLTMNVSEEALRRLTAGTPVEVVGKAVTDGTGKTRGVNAKATPSANDRGSVTFSFTGEKTKLTFNTTYRISAK